MPPNFGVKCPFYFEINLCHDYAAERSFHLLPSYFPCGWQTKISSLPLTFHLLNHTTGICRCTFRLFTHTPQIKSRVKNCTGARNRFIFPSLGYKLPHRHCSSSIGQSSFAFSFLKTLQKTPAFLPSSEKMASNKHAGEGSSGAPPLLRPRLG